MCFEDILAGRDWCIPPSSRSVEISVSGSHPIALPNASPYSLDAPSKAALLPSPNEKTSSVRRVYRHSNLRAQTNAWRPVDPGFTALLSRHLYPRYHLWSSERRFVGRGSIRVEQNQGGRLKFWKFTVIKRGGWRRCWENMWWMAWKDFVQSAVKVSSLACFGISPLGYQTYRLWTLILTLTIRRKLMCIHNQIYVTIYVELLFFKIFFKSKNIFYILQLFFSSFILTININNLKQRKIFFKSFVNNQYRWY